MIAEDKRESAANGLQWKEEEAVANELLEAEVEVLAKELGREVE